MVEWTEITVSIPSWEWETYAYIAYPLIGVIVFMGLVRTIPAPRGSCNFNEHAFLALIVAIAWLPALGLLVIMLPLHLLVRIARIGKGD